MRRLLRSARPRSASTVVAVLVLVLVALPLLLFGPFMSYSVGTGSYSLAGITRSQFEALELGQSRKSVQAALGSSGEDALQIRDTGTATEPLDADCLYWIGGESGVVVQMCFREDRLARKRWISP